MALSPGVNCGLVTSAPTADPEGNDSTAIDDNLLGIKITPTQKIHITEIGWWCNTVSQEANFEVGIYDNLAAGNVPTILRSGANQTNAKGSTAGWKTSAVDITLNPGTYWLAVQLDDTVTETRTYLESDGVGGQKTAINAGETTLPASFGPTGAVDDEMYSIYAVYTAEGGGIENLFGKKKKKEEPIMTADEVVDSMTLHLEQIRKKINTMSV